ncbi:uncharacterized protein LOC119990193 isoform X2 [Tripterygium wilfordii]|uniref:uncharacterized protein LOC119990193 isoform X2 n=1 Tax=Tripterygium wilfordii TaxID=458696 RepID=UPI0018F80525|nr:uncharacterized protein LOC119990193 isoform X2 [Tripterygium wilfordii]
MEFELEEDVVLKVLDTSLFHIKWRLKPAAMRRLQIGMRPVIMVDYGGKMPELQEHLCELVKFCQKESPIFEQLKVMVIEDMIYLIHVRGLAEHVNSSLNSETQILFVDLEQDPPKMIAQAEHSSVGVELQLVMKLFALAFPIDGRNKDLSSCQRTDYLASVASSVDGPIASPLSEFVDVSNYLEKSQVTIPTLNGWLLGYPVVYLFSKEHIADAIFNLSTKSLRVFRILVRRNSAFCKGAQQEELMSFSVPYDLSMGGSSEPWAEEFLIRLQSKWGKRKQTWRSLEMEVSECYPQAIVL